jgi:hypothetical protein
METREGVFRFVKVTKKTLFNFLQKASKRIVIAKPGYFKEEAEALIEIVCSKKIECNVFIDPSDNAVRFGFGETEALKIIKDKGSMLHCQAASHIRMSVVIVDDKALIYVPVALAWENESKESDYPNGIIGGQEFADVVYNEFVLHNEVPPVPEDERVFQETVIKQIEEASTKVQLEQSIKKLTENPPVDPSKLEEFTFYRNNFKILKTEIRGVKIDNKSISLRPFTRLLPKIDKRLKNSWQVFTRAEIKNLEVHKKFLNDINEVWTDHDKKRNLFNIQRHGHLIKASAKGEFEKQLHEQIEKFIQSLKSTETHNNNDSLAVILVRSRNALIDYLFTNIRGIEGSLPDLFKHNKIQYREFQKEETTKQKDEILKTVIESFVQEELHFPEINDFIEAVDIKCDYYDVSDELLRDEEFSRILSNQGLHDEIREYGAGYKQQGKKQSLFDEKD